MPISSLPFENLEICFNLLAFIVFPVHNRVFTKFSRTLAFWWGSSAKRFTPLINSKHNLTYKSAMRGFKRLQEGFYCLVSGKTPKTDLLMAMYPNFSSYSNDGMVSPRSRHKTAFQRSINPTTYYLGRQFLLAPFLVSSRIHVALL